MAKKQLLKILKNKPMCKISNTDLSIKRLDFSLRGKMAVFFSDGREVIVPLRMYPDIKSLSVKQRNQWMILDDQFFTFEALSKVYSMTDLLKVA